MKFDVVVGNPPYQENISSSSDNSALSKQLFPHFVELSIKINPQYLSLITPSRWFTGDAQDKSFLKLRDFIKNNNKISILNNYKNASEVFPGVEIKGGINFFLYDKNHKGKVKFINCFENKRDEQYRNLFEDDLDIIISESKDINIIKKIKNDKFTSITEITTGRNAFGIIGKPSHLKKVSVENKISKYAKLRCKDNVIRYINPEIIEKNKDIFNKYKVFISKTAGAPHSDPKVIGLSYIGGIQEACTDSLFPIGKFDTLSEAGNLQKYLKTKFLRYLVSIMKSSHNVTQLVYKYVPIQDFTSKSDIDWNKSIADIDQQLYKKYKLTKEEIAMIESKIKIME